MIEIEKFPCGDGNESRAREEYWRSHFNAQLNMRKSYITDEQNKDRISTYKKEYYEQNKDTHNKYMKEHYQQNKDKILKKQSQQITCECGCIISQGGLTRHVKSQNHLMKIGVLKYEFIDDNEKNLFFLIFFRKKKKKKKKRKRKRKKKGHQFHHIT